MIANRMDIKYFKYPETHKVLAVFELSKSQLFDKPSKLTSPINPFYWAERKFLEAMSMIPFFPSLRPTVGSSICIDADSPCDEESELRDMEKEHVAWVSKSNAFSSSFVLYWNLISFELFGDLQLKSIQQTASDLSPFGKVPPVGPDPETDDEGISIFHCLNRLFVIFTH